VDTGPSPGMTRRDKRVTPMIRLFRSVSLSQ